jgi:hypothetical protein
MELPLRRRRGSIPHQLPEYGGLHGLRVRLACGEDGERLREPSPEVLRPAFARSLAGGAERSDGVLRGGELTEALRALQEILGMSQLRSPRSRSMRSS